MTTDANQDDDILCDCSGTKRSDIKRMFNDGMDVDKMSSKTGIISGCGGCEWDIEDYIELLEAAKDRKA